jgi:hypothetical protein
MFTSLAYGAPSGRPRPRKVGPPFGVLWRRPVAAEAVAEAHRAYAIPFNEADIKHQNPPCPDARNVPRSGAGNSAASPSGH